ncbi:MAG: 2-succinyl-6-hydroxy-2,4-cyclohexadiene-1-carboxylate synthase [Deltaproteobacteria bacterium HGW-Deltaproteobacteria-10]|nr:MAG: 2-succinyl-6-hydroxy-2,4-cyclohexadiene-1-carboxylate synthase [Deltaproteobacteria bacterium HGW-Deltaproteobacteria-10]
MRKTVLHYEETGQPDSPVIFFLHGFMGQAGAFRIIMESLAESFRCISVDLPGHGVSLFGSNNRLNKLRGMEDTAFVILQDLDALEISRFTLYGYSMGGRIAQHVALAAPDRTDRLILESASFGIADEGERAERRQRDQALLADIKTPEEFRVFLTNWYSLPLFQTLPGTIHLQNLIKEKINHPLAEYRRSLNLLSVGGHSFLAEQLAECHIPIFYFCGEEDVAYLQTAGQIKTLLPDMTIRIFKNASHNIHVQYPQEISRAIREILDVG